MEHTQLNHSLDEMQKVLSQNIKTTSFSISCFIASIVKKNIVSEGDLQYLYQEMISIEYQLKKLRVRVERSTVANQCNTLVYEANTNGQKDAKKKNNLTSREIEVLNLFSKGFSYKEVSNILRCKISTVQTHIKRIYKKLGVHSKSEAVFEAINQNILYL